MQLQRRDFKAKPTPESYDAMLDEFIAFCAEQKIDLMDSIVIPATLNAGFEIRITVLWPKPDAQKA